MIALLLAMGCVSDIPSAPEATCTGAPPDAGVIVQEVGCSERLFEDGDGVVVDTWMASPHLHAIVRHPVLSRSLPGVGGGTMVDVATWDGTDVAYEWAPLVDGGWLDVDAIARDPDGVSVSGTVRSLPDARVEEGASARVRWSLDADAPIIHLDGADGLWMHPRPTAVRLGPGVVFEGTLVVTDATDITDLGGALRMLGVERIAVSPLEDAEWLDHPTTHLTADVDGADTLALRGPDGIVRLPVEEGPIDWQVPAAFTEVRAEGNGRAALPWQPIGQGLVLSTGAAGSVWVTVPNAVTPASVRWSHADGRTGRALTEAGLAQVHTGAGDVVLEVSAGPGSQAITRSVNVPANTTVPERVRIESVFDTEGYVPVQWLAAGERDRGSRATDAIHLLDAAHAGSPVTVLAPRDDVAEASIDAVIRVRNGGRLTSPDGWEVAAWPWDAHPRQAGHGAPSVVHRSPEEGLALAAQGPSLGRLTLVNAAWLDQAEPSAADPLPTGAMLQSLDDVDAWFRWLDAGRRIVPAGPVTWLPVPAPEAVLAVETERAWLAGHGVASTEGRIDFDVDGVLPGSRLSRFDEHTAHMRVHTAGGLHTVCLIVDGESWSCQAADDAAKPIPFRATHWALALATGPEDVAVTAAMWFGPRTD